MKYEEGGAKFVKVSKKLFTTQIT